MKIQGWILILIFEIIQISGLNAQSLGYITFNDTFTSGVTYCPGDRQYDNWAKFRNTLDTVSFRFLKVNMRGTYAKSARECRDSLIVRRLANALKNPGTMYSDSCNGFKWVVSVPGSCMASGCAKTTDNVGIAADGAINACACIKPSWQIRPAVGNSNWGGVNTLSCSPIPSQKMILEFAYILYQNDASVSKINPIDICKNPNSISTSIRNSGSKDIDSLKVFWSLNGKLQNSISLKIKIKSNADTLIVLNSSLNFSERTEYKIKVWTSNPNGINDENNQNDTIAYNFMFSGLPSVPDARDTSFCGSGEKIIFAKSKSKFDNIIWYNSAKSNKILDVGNFYKTQYHSPGIYKYFVSASGLLLNKEVSSVFTGGNQQAGFMMDIKSSEFITVDSIALNIGANAGTNADIEVYFIDSTFGKNETNTANWVNMGRFNVKCKGIGNPTTIPLKFNIAAKKRYGIYIQTTNVPSFYIQYTNGNTTYADDILKVNLPTIDSSGKVVYGKGSLLNWGGVFASRIGNIKFYYKIPVCESLRDSLTLTVNQLPVGAKIVKSNPFNTPDFSTFGTLSNPDIASADKEINYEIVPPLGYSNSEFGKTWVIKEIKFQTSNNSVVNAEDTVFRNPTTVSNAKLKYVPKKKLEDSLISISVVISDLKNSKCDSIIQRFIYIAYTPEIKVWAKDTCFGNVVKFANKTSSKSGKTKFKWFFGNGDSSEVSEPDYLYSKVGKYSVFFKATSDLGISKDTTFQVTVFDFPNIKFKVNNACEGDSVSFENSTTVSFGNINYNWNFGDGIVSKTSNPKHFYMLTGSYFVKLTAEANGCVATLVKKANYFSKPVADFNVRGICSYDTVFFTNKTKINGIETFGSVWYFGASEGSSNEANPKYIYNSFGTKIIKYKAISEFGCFDTISKNIEILPSAKASFTNGATCDADSVIFTNTSNENNFSTNYAWNFGDGNSITGIKNSKHLYSSLGYRTIILKASLNNGCYTTYAKEINVMKQPIADFEVEDGCIGKKITFNNKSKTSGQVVFKWRFGDGDSSFHEFPVKKFNPQVAATFNVSLMVFNSSGCRDTLIKPINIEENPICGFTVKSAQTGGFEYIFTPQVKTYNFYKWNFGDGTESSDITAKHKYKEDGNYQIKIFMKNESGCDCSDSSMVLAVNHLPVKVFKNDFIKVYPNPSSGLIIIEKNPLITADFNLKIFDTNGKKVIDEMMISELKKVFDLPQGLYFITVESNSEMLFKNRIIIVR